MLWLLQTPKFCKFFIYVSQSLYLILNTVHFKVVSWILKCLLQSRDSPTNQGLTAFKFSCRNSTQPLTPNFYNAHKTLFDHTSIAALLKDPKPRPTFPENQITELLVANVFFGLARHLVEVEVAIPDLEIAGNVVQVEARTLQLMRTLPEKRRHEYMNVCAPFLALRFGVN